MSTIPSGPRLDSEDMPLNSSNVVERETEDGAADYIEVSLRYSADSVDLVCI